MGVKALFAFTEAELTKEISRKPFDAKIIFLAEILRK